MKVGIITFHSAHNFGASLQCLALQRVLEKHKIEAYVINYHPIVIDNIYDPIKATGIKKVFKILSLKVNKNNDKLKRYKNYRNFIKNKLNLLGDFREYDDLKKANLDLDAYITGSDQVWNSQHTKGFSPAYFLKFAPKDKLKLSYAASIGRNYFIPSEKESIKKSLESFSSISVREVSAVGVVQELTDKKVEIVLDPTLLLEKKDYEPLIKKPNISEKYIFVYMMEENKELVKFANRISKAIGLPIVQRRQNKKFTNEISTCYTGTPEDFLGLIDNAELVITNSFHGAVFSVICETPFLAMVHSTTGSRSKDLLKSLGLTSHLVDDINTFNDIDKARYEDITALKNRIAGLRTHSLNYLEVALNLTDKTHAVECPTKITKDFCYGCLACKELCPTHAISMVENKEGFLYPVADMQKCTKCGLCEKQCIRNKTYAVEFEEKYPLVFSAFNKNEPVRLKSSSGAFFPALAEDVIDKKGYVVGVKFDENIKAVSIIVDNKEDLKALYGSKYVKSDFNGIFPQVKKLLDDKKLVLYTGLPCECAGLSSYLKKGYENLIICEIICHASPSPKVFKKYVDYLNQKHNSKLTHLEFRNKSTGWETFKCSMVMRFESGEEVTTVARRNNYFRAFQNDYICRSSCSNCHYVYDNRVGDITIGDFWGINDIDPQMYDGLGTSMLMVNTKKGEKAWDNIKGNFNYKQSNIEDAFKKNHKKPIRYKLERVDLFSSLDDEPINSLLGRFNDLKKKK